jgi:Family of unknown function (DUF6159)
MFGRMRQGWELSKKAWGVVRREPRLLRLPLTGGALALAAAIVIVGPGLLLSVSDSDGTTIAGYVLVALGSYVASCIVIFYNVVLAAAANDALMDRRPDIAAAKAVARSRAGAIAGWALVSVIVSVLLSVLRDKLGTAGRIFGAVGAAAWGFVTFLVVPVLALEGVGPITAVKRSGNLVKQRWGQQVTGNVVIGGLASLVTGFGMVMVVLGCVLLFSGAVATASAGAALVAVGIVIAIGGAVVAGATRGVFGVALYHFSADAAAIGPFTELELAGAAG